MIHSRIRLLETLSGVLLAGLVALPPAGRAELQGAGLHSFSSAAVSAQETGKLFLQDREQEEREREQEKRDKEQEKKDREQEKKDREQERKDRETELYDDGTEALDEGRWERAAGRFDQLARMGGSRTDAALYWKAYALNKLGRRDDALATLADLRTKFPQSRWLNDAKALEVEVRQSTGVPVRPEGETDEDLKLMALGGLQHTDPEQSVPMLGKILQGSSSLKIKRRALFVLGQIGTPQAREILGQVARGQSNPELQRKAVEYLGLFGGRESRQVLSDIYASSPDVDVKRAILRSFMVAGERERLLAAARDEKVEELRREAIRQLGVMSAQAELWQLYPNEPSMGIKEQIIQAMFVSGNAEKLIELAQTEKDAALRRKAVRNLGLMGSKRTGEALVSIYASEKDPDIRREVLNAFFLQGNAKALIEVARKETDAELKKTAVQKLSLMRSKEATEFLMEILNK